MKFIAIVEQSGDGCDYSIGCGIDYEEIEADTINDAWQKLIRGRWGDYDPRLGGLEDPHKAVKNDEMSPIGRVRMSSRLARGPSASSSAWRAAPSDWW